MKISPVYSCPWKAMKVSNKFGDSTMHLKRIPGEIDHELLVFKALDKSPFFPKLLKVEGSLNLISSYDVLVEIEKIVPFSEVVKYYPEMFDPENESHLSLIMFNVLLDLFGALIEMHGKGISHGNLNSKTFGWNASQQIWQMFDFSKSKLNCTAEDKCKDFKMLYRAVDSCTDNAHCEVFRKYPNPLEQFDHFFTTKSLNNAVDLKNFYFEAFVAYAEAAIGFGRLNPAIDKSIMASRHLFYENNLFK